MIAWTNYICDKYEQGLSAHEIAESIEEPMAEEDIDYTLRMIYPGYGKEK